jgi:anti-sigma regulatory factor (Ser/Thr protein kinase)
VSELVRTFPARRPVLREIREFIRERARDQHAGGEEADSLVLAVSEACANAMLHTNCTTIRVVWRSTGDRVEVDVKDDGVFRRRIPLPEIDGEGHRGIPLMMALLDQVSISGGTEKRPGTTVRLTKYLHASPRTAVHP